MKSLAITLFALLVAIQPYAIIRRNDASASEVPLTIEATPAVETLQIKTDQEVPQQLPVERVSENIRPTEQPTAEPTEEPAGVDPMQAPDWTDNGAACVAARNDAIQYGWYIEHCEPLTVWSVQEAKEKGLY